MHVTIPNHVYFSITYIYIYIYIYLFMYIYLFVYTHGCEKIYLYMFKRHTCHSSLFSRTGELAAGLNLRFLHGALLLLEIGVPDFLARCRPSSPGAPRNPRVTGFRGSWFGAWESRAQAVRSSCWRLHVYEF